jgi:hypothetical protein
MPMNMPMNMPMPTPTTGTSTTKSGGPSKPASPLTGTPSRSIKITTAKHGQQVQGTLKISVSGRGGHAVITVFAAHSALQHGVSHPKQLVTLGSTRLNHLRSGTAKFTVAVKGPARHALTAYRRLATTVRVTVTGPTGKTVTLTKVVLLHL